jgi:hypothetical protein
MWFGIEGNPRWLLEMLSLVNRKTNGRVKKLKQQRQGTRQHSTSNFQHPEKLQATSFQEDPVRHLFVSLWFRSAIFRDVGS